MAAQQTTVLVSGARTPMGRLLGGLSPLTAAELGGAAIRAALSRAHMDASAVDHVFMGQVLTAGQGQLPARQAAVAAGIPLSVPAVTVSKVCLSGIQSVIMADQYIRSGLMRTVVAGGQESMSQAPHLLQGTRRGQKFGSPATADHIALDGLQDVYRGGISMGLLAEEHNDADPVTRADQDAFAAASHQRATAAWESGRFAEEVTPLELPSRKNGPVRVERDEGIRKDSDSAALSALRPAFRPDGTITAGNASPISDGAAALVLMSREQAESLGVPWIAEILSPGMVAGPDSGLQHQPAAAIEDACAREGIRPEDLDLIEINEAFAAVALASARRLRIGLDRVNVNGGAIALGHPIGMSGTRVLLTLALELRRRGGGIGAAALCGGGGQGDALIIRVNPDAQSSRKSW